MKKILILLLGLVLFLPISNTLNATESLSFPQSTNDGWEKIGEVALYEKTSFAHYWSGLGYSKTCYYAKYIGIGSVYIKNVQGFKQTKIHFGLIDYFPSRISNGVYLYDGKDAEGGGKKYYYQLGENYFCNL